MKKILSIIFILTFFLQGNFWALAAGEVFQVDTGGTLNTGLLAYYKLEDVNDFFSTHTLTNFGTTQFNIGKVSNAADFGASNSTKYLRSTDDLGINGGSISMACWINITTQPGTNVDSALVAQGNATNNVSNFLRYQDSGGTKILSFARNRVGVTIQQAQISTTLTTGTWYDIVGTFDSASSTLYLYLNGTLQSTSTASGFGSGSGITEIEISGYYNTAGGLYSGLADECGIWSKALSQQEVTDLYNSGNGQTMYIPGAAAPTRRRMIIISKLLENHNLVAVLRERII